MYLRSFRQKNGSVELSPALFFTERVLWVPETETKSGWVFAVVGIGPETETESGLGNKTKIESGSG